MKILETRVMKGPNYWSIRRHKLVVMRLDLEDLEEKPPMLFRVSANSWKAHSQSLGTPLQRRRKGGFFKRVEEGTWMGHVVEHVALELQTLAGLDTGFGRTRGTGEKDL